MEVEQDGKTLTLKRAIMIYSGYHSSGGVVVSHGVSQQGVIGAGQFLKARDVCALGRSLYKMHERKVTKPQLHGDNVLGCGDEFLCFYVEPHERPLFFGKNLPEVSGTDVPLPRLVVVQKGDETYLFAVKAIATGRPSNGTPLFHAPLPEVDPDGSIHSCGIRYKQGVRFEPTKCDEISETILNARFNSIYTKKTCKGDYAKVLKGAIEAGKFPNDKLNAFGQTLGAFIESL